MKCDSPATACVRSLPPNGVVIRVVTDGSSGMKPVPARGSLGAPSLSGSCSLLCRVLLAVYYKRAGEGAWRKSREKDTARPGQTRLPQGRAGLDRATKSALMQAYQSTTRRSRRGDFPAGFPYSYHTAPCRSRGRGLGTTGWSDTETWRPHHCRLSSAERPQDGKTARHEQAASQPGNVMHHLAPHPPP